MDVHQKYELIEPLPGEGPKSFRARQSGFGRDVTVHFLVGGQTPENQALLARLRALPPNAMARLIEVGNSADGTQFVVTFAPPFQHLLEWLKDQESAAVNTAKFSRVGAWKVPSMSSPAPIPAPAPPVEPVQPGTFEDMFRTPEPTPTGQMMAPLGAQPQPAPAVAALPTPSPVASEPGEFTRLFQTSPVPAAAPARAAPPAIAHLPQASLAPVEAKPQPPAAVPAAPPIPPTVAAAPATAPVASEQGEFTRLFHTPVVPTAAPASSAPPAIAGIPLAPPEPGPLVQATPPAPPLRTGYPPTSKHAADRNASRADRGARDRRKWCRRPPSA